MCDQSHVVPSVVTWVGTFFRALEQLEMSYVTSLSLYLCVLEVVSSYAGHSTNQGVRIIRFNGETWFSSEADFDFVSYGTEDHTSFVS